MYIQGGIGGGNFFSELLGKGEGGEGGEGESEIKRHSEVSNPSLFQ